MIFGKKQSAKFESAIGLDLGSQQWKAVLIHRTERGLQLGQFAVVPAPADATKPSAAQQCAQAIHALHAQLKTNDRYVFVAISTPSALVAEIEVPRMTIDEVRGALALNGARFLRRDISNCCFDGIELGNFAVEGTKPKKTPTMRVLVAGAQRDVVLGWRNVLTEARLRAETIELSALTVVNALQRSQPAICDKHVVLLLEIGAQQTSLNFLRNGQPVLTRLMTFGGAQITEQMSRALGVPVAEAEKQKRAMGEEGVALARGALQTLAREVRSSIDFVERQNECEIRHAFVGGGSACNNTIVQSLSREVGLPMTRWNPLEGFGGGPFDEAVTPSLAAAVGVAVARL